MFEDRQSLFSTWGALALIGLIGLISCAPHLRDRADPPLVRWSSQNPLATSAGLQGRSQTASRDTFGESGVSGSLDQLRRGESPATPASSPLKDLYFAFDRYDLDPSARETLKANAAWLTANPSANVRIEGHCDERGTNEYNLALGARRADASKDYLVSLGIAPDRLSTISYGEEIPVCKEKTEECWARNRRARFVIMQEGPAS